jgi:hypothetical protein
MNAKPVVSAITVNGKRTLIIPELAKRLLRGQNLFNGCVVRGYVLEIHSA